MRRAIVLLLCAAACSSLKDASEETPPAPAQDAGTGAGTTKRDATATGDDDDVAGAKEAGIDAPVPCRASTCPVEEIASDLTNATTVTVAGDNVYFVDGGVSGGAVYQCPKTGCGDARVFLGSGSPLGIAVIGSNVVWSDFQRSKVFACAIGGCAKAPAVLADSETSVRGVWGDGTNVYWSFIGSGFGVTIRRCVPGACSPTNVTGGLTSLTGAAVSADGTLLFSTGTAVSTCSSVACDPIKDLGGNASGRVALANGLAFWIVKADLGTLESCPTAGCTSPKTVGGSPDPYAPAADATHVYWRDKHDDAVRRCPVAGCDGDAPIFADRERNVEGTLALDDDYVYWTTKTSVRRRHK